MILINIYTCSGPSVESPGMWWHDDHPTRHITSTSSDCHSSFHRWSSVHINIDQDAAPSEVKGKNTIQAILRFPTFILILDLSLVFKMLPTNHCQLLFLLTVNMCFIHDRDGDELPKFLVHGWSGVRTNHESGGTAIFFTRPHLYSWEISYLNWVFFSFFSIFMSWLLEGAPFYSSPWAYLILKSAQEQ